MVTGISQPTTVTNQPIQNIQLVAEESLDQPSILATTTSAASTKTTVSAPAATPETNTTPIVAAQPIPAVEQPAQTPYSLTYDGVISDLSRFASDGISQSSLRAQGIEVIAHNGLIPKRCASGPGGSTTTYGIAIKTAARYPACPSGEKPLYDAYKPSGYDCVVIYNRYASNSQAILAHELGHCLYFQNAQYGAFDIAVKKIRPIGELSRSAFNEILADEFMLCRYGLDTAWGAGSYHSRYGVAKPTGANCVELNALYTKYLFS
jgi:hypothetical protein